MSQNTGTEEFIELYTTYESRLRGYVLSLVPRWSDAEEITQRCSLILWKKISQFESGTNFYAWACHIARLEVKEFRKRQMREHVIFSDAVVDAVADKAVLMEMELPQRMHALQKCVESLSKDHRDLLRLRYDERRSVISVAEMLARPVEAIYKALSRIRHALHLCIDARIAEGEV